MNTEIREYFLPITEIARMEDGDAARIDYLPAGSVIVELSPAVHPLLGHGFKLVVSAPTDATLEVEISVVDGLGRHKRVYPSA